MLLKETPKTQDPFLRISTLNSFYYTASHLQLFLICSYWGVTSMREQLWLLQLPELLNTHTHPCLPLRNTYKIFSPLRKSFVLYSINTAWKLSGIVGCMWGECEGFCGIMWIQFQICHQWLLTPMATRWGRKALNLEAKRPGFYVQIRGSLTLQPLANYLTFLNHQN